MTKRWYLGKRHCYIESPISSMKTVLVMWADNGDKAIVPIRLCWRRKKVERPQ